MVFSISTIKDKVVVIMGASSELVKQPPGNWQKKE
jgi:hypothetical protein